MLRSSERPGRRLIMLVRPKCSALWIRLGTSDLGTPESPAPLRDKNFGLVALDPSLRPHVGSSSEPDRIRLHPNECPKTLAPFLRTVEPAQHLPFVPVLPNYHANDTAGDMSISRFRYLSMLRVGGCNGPPHLIETPDVSGCIWSSALKIGNRRDCYFSTTVLVLRP